MAKKLASNNNRAIGPFTSVPPLPRLVYYDGGTKWYYPLITPASTLTWIGYIFSYRKSLGDTFGIGLSNTKYVVPNAAEPVHTYDIPAGTYTPSAFENLIHRFISINGSRTVKNSFSVTVNGQTLSIAAGTKIYYVSQGSSPWYAKAVCFGSSGFQSNACNSRNGFLSYKAYIVETSNATSYNSSFCYNLVFRSYASYNITVNTGINFK